MKENVNLAEVIMTRIVGSIFNHENPICLAIINESTLMSNVSKPTINRKQIENDFLEKGIFTSNAVWKLVESAYKDLIHDKTFNSANVDWYLNILTQLRELLKGCEVDEKSLPPSSQEEWSEYIHQAVLAEMISLDLYSKEIICERYSRAAGCAKSLYDHGVEIIYDNGYDISDKGKNKLQTLLRNKCSKISGQLLLNFVLCKLGSHYSDTYGRAILNVSTTDHKGMSKPARPWNLLANIAAKYYIEPCIKSSNDEVEKLVQLVSNIAGVYDTQSLNQFDDLNISPYDIPSSIVDKSIFSSFFDVPQMDVKAAIEIIELVGEKFPNNNYSNSTIGTWSDSAIELLSLHEDKTPLSISKRKVVDHMALKFGQNKKHIVDFFFDSAININDEFKLPFKNSDLHLSPGIVSRQGNILLKNKSFAARGYVEKIFSACRSSDIKEFNGSIGNDLELLLAKIHTSKNIEFYSGRYNSKNNETDGVIVSDDNIHIFEFKIKALTEQSKSGNFVSTYADLVRSLLDSQRQAHEVLYNLKKYNKIKFKSGKEIIYKNQNIHLHSISLFDYGFLQNKIFVGNLLRGMTNYEFSHNDAAEDEKMRKLNVSLEKFREVIFRCQEESFLDNMPFHRTSFMSLSDLYLLNRRARNSEEYFNALNRLSSIVHPHETPAISIASNFDVKDRTENKKTSSE